MRKIAVLISGGDAPGMNAAIAAVVRTAKSKGLSAWGVMRGYAGLIEGTLVEISSAMVSGIANKGGTILKTSRCPEMMTEEGQEQAIRVLNAFGIEGLVIIGGDGSFKGAQTLAKKGIPTIGIPGTVDNDLAYTDFTIGFDTSVNYAVTEIAKIRDTMQSHDRIGVTEVMGNKCGDIALHAGVAADVEYIIVPEIEFDVDEICQSLRARRIKGQTTSIIVIAEGAGKSEALANYIRAKTGFDVKANALSYTQRGGIPTSFDRLIATRMGIRAVDLLLEGKAGRVIGVSTNQIMDYDIGEALAIENRFDKELYKRHQELNNY